MSKEKQIEEMAECLINIQQNFNEYCAKPCRECELGGIVNCENHYKAEALYNAGYRKQSEAEWTKDNTSKFKNRYNCSVCDYRFFGIPTPYCPKCGAKMKGGE